MKWGIERRMAFIEFRLHWDGQINRGDLVDKFGISPNQATKDLVRYSESHPDNITYDKHSRAYVRGSGFEPAFIDAGSEGYLHQLKSIAAGVVDQGGTWIGRLPTFDVIAAREKASDPGTLRSLVGAITMAEPLDIEHQGLTAPTRRWLSICPRAMFFDGFAWRIRAFSREHETFRDFRLSRIFGARVPESTWSNSSVDHDWEDRLAMVFRPNASLPSSQQQVVARDFGMINGRLEINTRRALVSYLLRQVSALHDQGSGSDGALIVLQAPLPDFPAAEDEL